MFLLDLSKSNKLQKQEVDYDIIAVSKQLL